MPENTLVEDPPELPISLRNANFKNKLLTKDLLWVLGLSTIFLVGWTLAVPMYESPDEKTHWDVAEYIHEHHSLPLYGPTMIEGNQPPLYYLLVSPFAANTKQPKFEFTVRNHQPVFQCFPRIWQICSGDLWRFWPMRTARIFTALISVAGVFFVYLAALEALGYTSVAVLAACLTAFLPGFAFRGGNISNDAMVAAASAAATWSLILILKRGFTWRRGILASLLIGIAFVAKVNAVILFPGLVITVLIQPDPWPRRVKRLAALLPGVLLISPWLIRNKLLYGDILASKAMFTAVPALIDRKEITSAYFVTTFPKQLYKTGVGTFGGVLDIYLPDAMYAAYLLLFATGLFGVVYLIVKRKIDNRLVLLLFTLCVLAFLSVVQLNLTFSQPQGRYLYVALPAFMILVAAGLTAVLRNGLLTRAIIAVLILGGVYALVAVEIPAYHIKSGNRLDTAVVLAPSEATIAGPLHPGHSFGQTFESEKDGLDEVDILLATWARKLPKGVLILHLRDAVSSPADIAVRRIKATQIVDNQFLSLKFHPIANSKGRSFYLLVDQQNISDDNPVTVYVSKLDKYKGGEFYRDGHPAGGDVVFRTFALNDSACMSCAD